MGFIIEPERVYHEFELLALGLFRFEQLERGRKKGILHCAELGRGQRTYKGCWLLDWLEQASAAVPEARPQKRRRDRAGAAK